MNLKEQIYVGLDKTTKILVCPALVIGSTLVNVTVEYYRQDLVQTRAGIPAAGNGWHVRPTFAYRFDKKPMRTECLSVEDFYKKFGQVTFEVWG